MIIKEELRWLMEAINEQFETIAGYEDKIPIIEYDILMENIRKLYDDLRRLQRLNEMHLMPDQQELHTYQQSGTAPLTPVKTAEPSEYQDSAKPSAQAIKPAQQVAAVKAEIPGSTDAAGHRPDHAGLRPGSPGQHKAVAAGQPADDRSALSDYRQPAANASPDFTPDHITIIPAGTEETATDSKPDPAPAIHVRFDKPPMNPKETSSAKKTAKTGEMDLFAMEEPTFSIRLQEAREKSLGPKVPADRIENLKNAITINEKFMFINELFDGNLREYNETIETLNGFKNLGQAADFLDLMRKKNFWDTGSKAFQRLRELLERKF